MTTFSHLVQMWALVKENRDWLEDLLRMNSCDCDAGAECSYRDAYPHEHAFIQGLLHLLDGRDLPRLAGGMAA